MGLSLKPVTHILLIDVPAQVAVSLITEESQIQLARAIFNPLTNILTKRMSFCYIVISSPLQDFNFVRKKLKVFMANSEKLWSGNANFLWEAASWFSGGFRKPLPQILNVVGCFHWTRSTTVSVTSIGICDTSSLAKFGHETFNCSSVRYFIPAKIFSVLLLCQNHRFGGKVRLYYFCPLLRSKVSTIIRIDVTTIS